MKTISEILQEQGCEYFDHKLTWVANANHFKKEIGNLEKDQTPTLIKVDINIELHSDTRVFEHHKGKITNKSSLEQLVE